MDGVDDNVSPEIEAEAQAVTLMLDFEFKGYVSTHRLEGQDYFVLTDKGQEKAEAIYTALPVEDRMLVRMYIGNKELDRISEMLEAENGEEEDNSDGPPVC